MTDELKARPHWVQSTQYFLMLRVFAFFMMAILTMEPAWATPQEDETEKQRTKAVAVALWTGMAALAVFCLGIGLMWGISRAARRLLKRREPVHTEMPDIWFLNPPDKGKPDKP